MFYDVKVNAIPLSTGKELVSAWATSPRGLCYRASWVGVEFLVFYRQERSTAWKKSRMTRANFFRHTGIPLP